MKIFAIRDASFNNGQIIGYLFYHEPSCRFFAELPKNVDEWTAPFMFAGFVRRGILSIGSLWSGKWVDQRIIPPDRQNLGMILKANGLKEYDRYRLLMLTQGRCPQDDCYIEAVDEAFLPEEIAQRQDSKVREVYPISGGRLLIMFRDDTVRMFDVSKYAGDKRVFSKILTDRDVFSHVCVTPFGFGVEWGEDRWIPAEILRKAGTKLPFSLPELIGLFNERVISTSKAAELLGCSRQYINQLDRRGVLICIREEGNMRFYLRSDVEKLKTSLRNS